MVKVTRGSPTSTSKDRGLIDSGQTGEKVAGFDPATVPMETDAEAGGTATEPIEVPPMPSIGDFNATSHGTAMRAPPGTARSASNWWLGLLVTSLVGLAWFMVVII